MIKLDYCNIPVVYRRVTVEHHSRMREWLYNNVEPECYDAERWACIDDNFDARQIWFSNEHDAILFAMKWC